MGNQRRTYWKLKVTAYKNYKCGICKSNLNSDRGFLELKKEHNFYKLFYIRICYNCLVEIYNELPNRNKEFKEKYKLLIKKAIVRNLR